MKLIERLQQELAEMDSQPKREKVKRPPKGTHLVNTPTRRRERELDRWLWRLWTSHRPLRDL